VKLYTSILDADSDWLKMTDAECGVLAKMLALAARMNNAMPYNSEVISEEINASSPVDLDSFVNRGLFEVFSSRAECVDLEQVRVAVLKPASKNASDDASKSASKNARLREQSQSQSSEGEVKEETKTPPTPRKRVAVEGVVEVVEYLNQVTGRGFSLDRGNKEIEGALKRGATVEDCRAVIDRCWNLWRDKPEMVHNVNKVTPFRASHFDTYLDEWRAGRANTGESGTKPKIVLSPEHQRLMEDLKKIAADAGVET
jgi:uncharacterized phage protein (TIGR02220 family)